MLRAGCVALSLWLLLNLVPSAIIVVRTLTGDGHTPALYMLLDQAEVDALDERVLATLDSIAVYANSTNVALALLALAVVWLALAQRSVWAFWVLLLGFSCSFCAGIAADAVVGFVFPEVNALSGLILVAGFGFSALGIFRDPTGGSPD